jgi:hypothetical protein
MEPVVTFLRPFAVMQIEEFSMFVRKGGFSTAGRAAAMATVAALAVTAFEPSLAFAGSAPQRKGTSVASSAVTDISARRRHYQHYRGGGGAAAAAAFAGIVGTGLAIAATQNRRDYYDGYYGGPAYYGSGPYYGGPAYYGGGYRPYGYGW